MGNRKTDGGDSLATASYSFESSSDDITTVVIGDQDTCSSSDVASVFCSNVLDRLAQLVIDEDEAEEGSVSLEWSIATQQLFPLATEVIAMQPYVVMNSSSYSPLSFAIVGF